MTITLVPGQRGPGGRRTYPRQMDNDEDSGTQFPASMGKVSRRELANHGYTRYDQLPTVTPKQLLAIHGVGPKAIRILAEELAARGLAFGCE